MRCECACASVAGGAENGGSVACGGSDAVCEKWCDASGVESDMGSAAEADEMSGAPIRGAMTVSAPVASSMTMPSRLLPSPLPNRPALDEDDDDDDVGNHGNPVPAVADTAVVAAPPAAAAETDSDDEIGVVCTPGVRSALAYTGARRGAEASTLPTVLASASAATADDDKAAADDAARSDATTSDIEAV